MIAEQSIYILKYVFVVICIHKDNIKKRVVF